MKLYCATTNPGKLREFQLAVTRLGAGEIDIETLPGLVRLPPCEETGATFEENAVRKAICYSQYAPGLLFADDSGLAVDALQGAPGVLSARFAGENAADEENNQLLLDRMRGVANRQARFICVVALADKGALLSTFRGTVEGLLLEAPRGNNGFGYDPLFFHPPFNATLAEISPERKLTVSHRGQAIEQLLRYLESSRQVRNGGLPGDRG